MWSQAVKLHAWKRNTNVKAWLSKLGNIVAETLFLVMFPYVAKLAGNKQNVVLSQRQNEQTLLPKQMSYACVR